MKWATLRVSTNLILSVTEVQCVCDYEKFLREQIKMPPDYRLIAVTGDTRQIQMILEHEAFDDLPAGAFLPDLNVQLGQEEGLTVLHSVVYEQGGLRFPVVLYERSKPTEQPV